MFWRLTPARHRAILLARRRQLRDASRERVALDHMQAEMNALAAIGKPRPLEDYLARFDPPKRRSALDMLAVLRRAGGSKITITKVEG